MCKFIWKYFIFLKFPIYRYGYSYVITSLILISIFFMNFYDTKKLKFMFTIFIFNILVYKQSLESLNMAKREALF